MMNCWKYHWGHIRIISYPCMKDIAHEFFSYSILWETPPALLCPRRPWMPCLLSITGVAGNPCGLVNFALPVSCCVRLGTGEMEADFRLEMAWWFGSRSSFTTYQKPTGIHNEILDDLGCSAIFTAASSLCNFCPVPHLAVVYLF